MVSFGSLQEALWLRVSDDAVFTDGINLGLRPSVAAGQKILGAGINPVLISMVENR